MSRCERTSGKSKRKHSKADSFKPPPSEPEPAVYEEESAQPETWPPPTFLFTINELPVNTAELPRYDGNGYWHPPLRRNGFLPQVHSNIFRWAEGGRISEANDCQLFNSQWWSRDGSELIEYRTSTIFWCDNFTQFMVATGDASLRDMDQSVEPNNRWWPLTFRHEGSLSRVSESGDEPRLAGTGGWINGLGLSAYRHRHTTPAGGLAGNLAIVIGLIAFSCESTDLNTVLLNDRAWRRGGRWHGHSRENGRIDERGVVVTIYLDPENPQGSSNETIYPLEWTGGTLVY